jgi:hypothetical protein
MVMTVKPPVFEGSRSKGALGEGEGTVCSMAVYACQGHKGDPGMAGKGMWTGTIAVCKVLVHLRVTLNPDGDWCTSPLVVWRV